MTSVSARDWERDFESDFEAALEFRSTLAPETDRGCALIAAAYLDDRLSELLRSYFADDRAAADDVLGQSKPLGTFSSRIDVAYLLGLLSKEEHEALHLIRKIRNAFSHVAKPILFDSPEIASRCKNLESVSCVGKRKNRGMFTGAVMAVLAGINHGCRTAKHREIRKNVDLGWKTKGPGLEAGAYQILRATIDYSDAPTAAKRKALESTIAETLKYGSDDATDPSRDAVAAKKIVDRLEKFLEQLKPKR